MRIVYVFIAALLASIFDGHHDHDPSIRSYHVRAGATPDVRKVTANGLRVVPGRVIDPTGSLSAGYARARRLER